MSSERFQFGDIVTVQGRFEDATETPVTNATGRAFVRRNSDDQYFNGTTFQMARLSLIATEISDTNSPGWWKFVFDTSFGLADDCYAIELVDTSGNSVSKLEIVEAIVGGYVKNLDNKISDVKAKTDNLPSDPTSEAVATGNKNEIIAEIDENDLALEDVEAMAVGRAKYDPLTSIETLFKKNQPTVVHKTFNCKDKNGNPAGNNTIFERIPI